MSDSAAPQGHEVYDDAAELYDLAFSWDVEREVGWLLERLGPDVRSVLEPACGSGRFFPGLARRGVLCGGVDISERMLERARARMRTAGLPEPLLLQADMETFDLGRRFDGAVIPLGSFAYLRTEDAVLRHFDSVARHLAPGRRYLVQLGLRRLEGFRLQAPTEHSVWDEKDPATGRVVRCSWLGESYDARARLETIVSHFEVVDGPGLGRTALDRHRLRVWDWASWSAVLDRSPFRQEAAWDWRKQDVWPRLALGPELEDIPLVWHELALK